MIAGIAKKMLGLLQLEYKYGRLRPVQDTLFAYDRKVSGSDDGNMIVKAHLHRHKNLLIARIGRTELKLVLNYLHYRKRRHIPWQDQLREEIWKQSGIFPGTDESLKAFTEQYLECIAAADVMGIWYNEGEDEVVNRYCPEAELIELAALEPYFFGHPWSKALEHKKVLVIHPFEASIRHQYQHHRSQLFANEEVLPLFDLQTVKAIQTQTFNTASYNNWQDVYRHMQDEVSHKDFDIALIGAGAYGLMLGAHVKAMGKKAIHMGGATQLLFGIKGKRWEDRPEFRAFFNEHWKNPNPDERPGQAVLLEGGAYW